MITGVGQRESGHAPGESEGARASYPFHEIENHRAHRRGGGLLAALGLVSPPAAGAATASTPDTFSETAQQQIAALQAVKAGRTAAESKVDSKLLVAEKGLGASS